MKILNFYNLIFIHFIVLFVNFVSCADESILVVSVATEETDGYLRFIRSLKKYNYDFGILGLGEKWIGGGQKINLVLRELEKYKDDLNKVILITDSYDVVVTMPPQEVLDKFKSLDAKIIFGAESFCRPDSNLEEYYPKVGPNQKRFLNSGGIIGYADYLYNMIKNSDIQDTEDDQYIFTRIFLDVTLREKFKIKLDTRSDIFQNLDGAVNEISVIRNGDDLNIFNNITQRVPAIIHGNGPTKKVLNSLGNYIAKAYSVSNGCVFCQEDTITLDSNQDLWPEVTVGIFVDEPTPFLREFFAKFSKLNYPKSKMSLLIYNIIPQHDKLVENFILNPSNTYFMMKYLGGEDDSPSYEAKTEAVNECKRTNCKYYFHLSSLVHLDNPDTLKLLIEQNRSIIAPIMTRPETTWSNVWGDISPEGFYARSTDYIDIITRKKIGVWNLPYISDAILMSADIINRVIITFEHKDLPANLALATNLREQQIFMYGTNMHVFGHLINQENFNISLIRPELYQIMDNWVDWADRYVHSDYEHYLKNETDPLSPCPDVFWFPMINDEACEDIITMMEDFGQWSGGNDNTKDNRLQGGYENVPTVDIHFTQLGWNNHWLYFLKKIIQPMQMRVFHGYYSETPKAHLNFVVRYRPGEQDHLKPHNDASKYTLNLALNRPKIDFQGGGVRYLRYNCSVLETKKGWGFIHPGRLTHYHEGLKVTGGTRYILVSFIDP